MATPAEIAAMRRAIAVSAAGLGTTSPNPPAGCVLLLPDGRLLGEGYHERKGEAHAAAQALTAAGPGALPDGATAVITLEPCGRAGRRPACSQALIDARVSRVVIALTDPAAPGPGGVAALRAAGLEVETGVLAAEAAVVLGSWLGAQQAGRPVITWPYLIAGHGIVALPNGTDNARVLRLSADAVLRPDGRVTEAIPGSHGKGALDLIDPQPGADPVAVAVAAYRSGVRRLLLTGGLDVAAPFLAARIVDQVIAYIPHGNGSRKPSATLPWPLLPPGFAITGAIRLAGFVRIDAQPEPASRPAR
jgi:diaminohydroxyphosphoribosylaminopyrimidine deaminase / 5-amino-6-(5-phosphoribosylamino)uracil reductase